jgi:hypothetical protein
MLRWKQFHSWVVVEDWESHRREEEDEIGGNGVGAYIFINTFTYYNLFFHLYRYLTYLLRIVIGLC